MACCLCQGSQDVRLPDDNVVLVVLLKLAAAVLAVHHGGTHRHVGLDHLAGLLVLAASTHRHDHTKGRLVCVVVGQQHAANCLGDEPGVLRGRAVGWGMSAPCGGQVQVRVVGGGLRMHACGTQEGQAALQAAGCEWGGSTPPCQAMQ